jgi:hypothetical protein
MHTLQRGSDIVREDPVKPPSVLYKYLQYHRLRRNRWTRRIFEDSEVFFGSPRDFNDPFDSRWKFIYPRSELTREALWRKFARRRWPDQQAPWIGELIATGADISYGQSICDDMEKMAQEEYGVLCLAERGDNILMWSHYANQHTGFCLEFQTGNPLFSRARKVAYPPSKERPCQDLAEYLTVEKQRVPKELVTKAEDWAREEEWRIVEVGGAGMYKFPPHALTAVILGCRMAQTNRERIKEWCRKREPRPLLCEAKEKEWQFGLNVLPVSY